MHKYIHLHTIYYTDTRVSHSIRRSRATKELSRARRRDFSFSSVKEAHSMQTSECALQHMWNTAKLFEISIPSFLRVYSAEYENESTKRFYANERMYRHDDFTWKVTKKNVAKLSRGFETCFSSREFWNDSYLKKNYQVDYQFPN